jgi:PAS domain S-box-containing protein
MPRAISLLRRHSLALLVTALAFIFTMVLWPLGHHFLFALFIAAILASAWQGGPASALVTTVLSAAVLFGLYFLLSSDQIAELGFDYLTRLGLFVFVGLLASFLSYQHQRASRALSDAGVILANASVALIVADRQGRVTSLNAEAQALTGWNSEEATGRPVGQIFHLRTETGDPIPMPVDKVLEDGNSRALPAPALVVALDGRQTPIEGAVAALHDSADRLTGLVISFRDETDRKQAEAAARSREDHLQARLAEQDRAAQAWNAERQKLEQALAALQEVRHQSQSELQTAQAEVKKANQALVAGRAQADEDLRQLRAEYEKQMDSHAQKLAQAEADLREARLDQERRLAEMAAGHEQKAAALRQAHAELSQKLGEMVDRHGQSQGALQNTQAELAALREQHQVIQAQGADAAERARLETEEAVRQIHSDWEKRLAEQQRQHEELHAALQRELADHQELLKELDQEEQTLRQERDFYLSLLLVCGMSAGESSQPSPAADPAREPAPATAGNGAAHEPAPAADGRTHRLDWLAFN